MTAHLLSLPSNEMSCIVSPSPIKPFSNVTLYSISCTENSSEEAAHAELASIMAQCDYLYQKSHLASPVFRTINPLPNDTLFCTMHRTSIQTPRAVTSYQGQECVPTERGFVVLGESHTTLRNTCSYDSNSEMAAVY